ncbi:hypothetical protein [Paludisphaera mucosa]|uniref:MotA/TolQ/ExbB proton channel domain-containing protein n=1 Tax=Paludisphaera mucosa TaxID=3030827 RepID=A0ABT6F6G2_9BACT|nr:hypothetical protein [Paludisphaera mucosa]MDG3003104.1 hypothetical protein [Paludisphaera mucosa]
MPPTIIPLAGIALPLILVPTIMLTKNLGQRRYYRHLERMQALKSGLPVPASTPLPGPGSVVAIGAGVPIVSILGALIATASIPWESPDVLPLTAIIWSMSLFLALGGLTTALILGVLLHRAHRRSTSTDAAASAKPAYDPDMFEPAGRGY